MLCVYFSLEVLLLLRRASGPLKCLQLGTCCFIIRLYGYKETPIMLEFFTLFNLNLMLNMFLLISQVLFTV